MYKFFYKLNENYFYLQYARSQANLDYTGILRSISGYNQGNGFLTKHECRDQMQALEITN